MLLGGDEIGRTQGGNNNAWCQDNEISWFDWELATSATSALLAFTRRLIRLRREHPVFRRATFLPAQRSGGLGAARRWWFRADGRRMTARDWNDGAQRARDVPQRRRDPHARRRTASTSSDDSFLVLFNGHTRTVTFTLPSRRFGARWALELSTADPAARAGQPSGCRRGPR